MEANTLIKTFGEVAQTSPIELLKATDGLFVVSIESYWLISLG